MPDILVYGDIDLNVVDGSSIWVNSIINTLSQRSENSVTLLLKTSLFNGSLIQNLQDLDNVSIIDLWKSDLEALVHLKKEYKWTLKSRLTPQQAAEVLYYLDKKYTFDLILVRSYQLSKIIAYNYNYAKRTWFYITEFPQQLDNVTHVDLEDLNMLYENCSKIACQTEQMKEYYKMLLSKESDEKFIYIPPMVPNYDCEKKEFNNKNNTLIYAGKIAPLWKAPEMFEAFNEINDMDIKFIVVSNKFYNYPYIENFEDKVKFLLENSSNIVWRNNVSRELVQDLIKKSDIGITWRDKLLDESLEISTKLLEYGIHGKPVIMNKNNLHTKVFGQDYPLFVNNKEEFKEKIKLAINDKKIYEKAANNMFLVSKQYTFSKVYEYLEPYLPYKKSKNTENKIVLSRKIKLLFAGHDFKFARSLINYFETHDNFEVRLDQWDGHNKHDKSKSQELLKWANIIFVEWGLGNAVWYSKYKNSKQILVIRVHRQEINTDFFRQIKWNNVDKLIYIAPNVKKESEESFDFLPKKRSNIIYNSVDLKFLDRDKLPNHEFNIGIVGVSPSLKRLDLAFDILQHLCEHDKRYTMFVKGCLPNEYHWLWERENEREYFLEIFERINKSPWRNSIVFDGWGNDIGEWFRKIGFILSTSDLEGSHQAVPEGMASGAIPIIRNWKGARDLYPNKFIFENIDDAVDMIVKYKYNFNDNMREVKEHVRKNYDKDVICNQWEQLLLTLCG